MYQESNFLMLSALQHLAFCERQCALIHIEQQWSENRFTTLGNIMHERVHSNENETRGSVKLLRGLRIHSFKLGLSGQADMVELHKKEGGRWKYYPIEYKRGKPKKDHCDRVQLCAQAICLEEMNNCLIEEGALFYGKNRRRFVVEFNDSLREETEKLALRLHELFDKKRTPKAVYEKKCDSCSLINICMPALKDNIVNYIDTFINEETS